ncbi:MAG: hypothetical protein HQK79_12635 [Desulfobacterales bacterium]|nr:hypothetical protein [Desulfobacterales bacterium]
MKIEYKNFRIKVITMLFALSLLISCMYVFPVFAEDYRNHRRSDHQDNSWNKDSRPDRRDYRDNNYCHGHNAHRDKGYYNHNRYEHHKPHDFPVYKYPPVNHYNRLPGLKVFLPGINIRICNR